ncbi:phosphonate C-P lyase system protein PhnH [Litoreibacter sp.]|nr:phosphonate C-P lyase system protein PhnH [Litoreibacter sp.]
MQPSALSGGFANASIEAADAFRQIMNVLAHPGDIAKISGAAPPAPMSVAAGTAILTLCDPETPIFLAPSIDTRDICDWITFHTGAPIVVAEKAQFALGRWDELPITAFQIGTPEYPDSSATLIVEMDEIVAKGATLRGPGIKDSATLSLPEIEAFQKKAKLFPLGLDFFFTEGCRIAGLPRTTKVT